MNTAHSTAPIPALPLDIGSILIFALLARMAHNSAELPLSFFGWLDTAWPFLLGVAAAWGLWGSRVIGIRHWGMYRFGTLVWLCAVLAGLGIWTLTHGHLPHWSFVLVASVTSAIFLFGWRYAAHALSRKRLSTDRS